MRTSYHTRLSRLALMSAASMLALTVAANAAASDTIAPEVESVTVTVTGSLVIDNIAQSPTPITSISLDQLEATTPTDLGDALQKLPDITGGNYSTMTNGGGDGPSHTLSLRNFGAQRTLILLDGHRLPPSNQDGSVSVDTLPTMLVKRVDIVTGGASAVYGSDAVAGVVNYVLDRNFTGFKYDVHAGISDYGDAASYQAKAAWGTDLFGGRGHVEVAGSYYHNDEVHDSDRPYLANGNSWVLGGQGTAASPYTNVPYGRQTTRNVHGTINCGTGCAYNTYTFNSTGVMSPMTHGTATGITNIESGGDGGYYAFSDLQGKVRKGSAFGRFSYDLTQDVNAYVQASWSETGSYNQWTPWGVSASSSQPNTFFANNPYLSADTQAKLTASSTKFLAAPTTSKLNGTTPPAGPAGVPFFQDSSTIYNNIGGVPAGDLGLINSSRAVKRLLNVEVGLTGTLGQFAWDAYYGHGENRLTVTVPYNTNNAKMLASFDAVTAPKGTVVNGVDLSGSIVCWVTTQPAYAKLYPGCVPTNAFDPAGPSVAAFKYVADPTWWTLTQRQDVVGGTIHGGLWGLGLPAGEITAALSGSARWQEYDMVSPFDPAAYVDCTGLRLCMANGQPGLYKQNQNGAVDKSQTIYEAAGEFNIPLLKDFPLAQDVSLDVAGRYTNYSIFGDAPTWKFGLNWLAYDGVRFRGSYSMDIRAPSMNDLYQPSSIASNGFSDLLTNTSSSVLLATGGNPKLVPEQAHTMTAGVVLTPNFLPGALFSLDYYKTSMHNAISSVSATSTGSQQACINSAPAYNSPYCTLYDRPLLPGDPNYRTSANYPTLIRSAPANIATTGIEGWDVEFDYNWDMADVVSWFPGSFTFRHLIGYQPGNGDATYIGPKTRMTSFLSYSYNDWSVNLQNRWLSSYSKVSSKSTIVYDPAKVGSYNSMDVTIDRRLQDFMGGTADIYLSIQNIGNTAPPLYATNNSDPGIYYPTPGYYSAIGRYFTIGFKANL